ncbi:FAD-dependent oxidoreductase [bacterium]|nr:FAD-dependent oxidoreductase [bacterium]
MKYIIVGNGVAGMAAAEAIRGRDAAGGIHIYTEEEYYHYSRPRVIEYLGGLATPDKIVIRGPEYYAKLNIQLFRGTAVESIDTAARTISTRAGVDSFDKLILASGATSFLPPVEGCRSDCVFTLRTIADADRILARCASGKRALVIGGGLLGIETAASLAKRGLCVSVVEVFDRLLPRQLDADGAALLRTMLERQGLAFLLPKKTAAVRPAGEGADVFFDDGSSAGADLVIFSAGVRSNARLAAAAGIACDRGILVDGHMETSAPGIYAAGDAAQFNGVVYGLWPAAKEQGSFAGRNAAGEPALYQGSQLSAKLKVSGIELASLGAIGEGPGIAVATKRGEGTFRRLFLSGGRLAGAILIGDTSSFVPLQRLLKSGEPIADPEAL